MTKTSTFLMSTLLGFLLVGSLGLSSPAAAATRSLEGGNSSRKTFIVHVAKSQKPSVFRHHDDWYEATLRSVSESAEMIYTYSTMIHGFSACLTALEAESLVAHPGILSVLPERRYELHTTRTPEFLGIEGYSALIHGTGSESDVIVGVLDTGVWPERRSYNDAGLGPVPAGWKGECDAGTNFTAADCNRKLIGARFLLKGYEHVAGPINVSVESRLLDVIHLNMV